MFSTWVRTVLGDGTGVFQDIADLDRLVDQLSQSYTDSSLGDVDLDVLQRLLGDEATAQVRSLQDYHAP